MKIIIPMTGLGQRFIDKGYTNIKPLIEVHGKPMIAYVVSLFGDETEFVFICRDQHIRQTPLKEVLQDICPTGKIVVQQGDKKGPVYPVWLVSEHIEDAEPVTVCYCDFFMAWNYEAFIQFVKTTQCDGVVPCYTGFHPHLCIEKNVYASCRVTPERDLLEIQEKHVFSESKFTDFHSAGLYYFRYGRYVKTYFKRLMDSGQTVNGEYYVSMVYNAMVQDRLKIKIYDQIPYFCQWGTPEDLAQYLYWANIFK